MGITWKDAREGMLLCLILSPLMYAWSKMEWFDDIQPEWLQSSITMWTFIMIIGLFMAFLDKFLADDESATCCAGCGSDTLAGPDDARSGELCDACSDDHAEYASAAGCDCADPDVACRRWLADARRRERF